MAPTKTIYRCHCGANTSELPSQSVHDVCERCGTGFLAQHVGSAPAAQPSPAMQVAKAERLASPLKAAVQVPTGNPAHAIISKTVVSNGKVSVIKIDAVTGRIINDTRQG